MSGENLATPLMPASGVTQRAISTLDKLADVEMGSSNTKIEFTPPQHLSELVKKNRELEHYGKTVAVTSYICFVLTMIATFILGGVFYVSKTLDQERKSFLLLIIGLCGVGFIVVMIIARRNWTTLLIFTVLSTFISGFSLGLSIGYV